MYAVETGNLTKFYNGLKAVDELNLKVPEGSIYGFLGPNGAGKTTTIKMLTGLSKPSSGEIRIYGRPVKFGGRKNRMNIGYLPEVPGFYEWMTAEEFLVFMGELFSIDKMCFPGAVHIKQVFFRRGFIYICLYTFNTGVPASSSIPYVGKYSPGILSGLSVKLLTGAKTAGDAFIPLTAAVLLAVIFLSCTVAVFRKQEL